MAAKSSSNSVQYLPDDLRVKGLPRMPRQYHPVVAPHIDPITACGKNPCEACLPQQAFGILGSKDKAV